MNLATLHRAANVALLAAVSLAAFGCNKKHPDVVATPPPVVLVSQPVERTVSDYQVFTARTQAVESVDIKTRVNGFLTKVLFKDGANVKEGDILFQIDDRPYKATLDQAKASLSQAKASLDRARANLVEKQAYYDEGHKLWELDVKAISQQNLATRLGARDEARANIDVTTAAIGQAQSALEMAQLNYGWCTVTAPISGRANRHLVDVGSLVTQDVTMLTNIVSIKPIWAYFDVDQNTASRYQDLVLKGEVESPRKDEIPADMAVVGDVDFAVKGVIDFVSNQFDPNTGSVRLRAVFPNDNGTLVAGLFGRVRVPISAPHPALLVTDSAVGTNQSQRFVLVVNDQNEVEYRAVDVGQMHGSLREVLRFREVTETGPNGQGVLTKVEVLKPTDRVIVEGLQRVRPGVKVEPKLVSMTTLLVKTEPEPKKVAPKSK